MIGRLCVAIVWMCQALINAAAFARTQDKVAPLLRDERFEQGVVLLSPEPGRKVRIGVLLGRPDADPVWELAQWSSRFPLTPVHHFVNDGSWGASNAARYVLVDGHGTVTLAANGILEYGGRLREPNEPWPHLLLQQTFVAPPRLRDLAAIELSAQVRVGRCVAPPELSLNPRRHAAQLLMFLTVQNLERSSSTYGDYLWFGVPFYDSRRTHPSQYIAPDKATGKLIWTAPAEALTQATPHGGEWCQFRADLLPFMMRAVEDARTRGFLRSELLPGDHRLTSLNVGWELPGPFDVEAQIRGLNLRAVFLGCDREPQTDATLAFRQYEEPSERKR